MCPVETLLAAPEFAEEDRELGSQGEWEPPFGNAADTDYAIADKRTEAFAASQGRAAADLGQRYSPIINGEAVTTEA
jgi:RHH-type proline utilization regulon transcriptional repressor/proline dehydrogenase/delta 1-pyrroline-5-carboxylate dehydrogenase